MSAKNPSGPSPDTAVADREAPEAGVAYWKANIGLVRNILIVWTLVCFGFGIILRPLIAGIPVGGTDLGFWFAQQGSMLVFVALIFIYSAMMNKIDKQFGMEEQ